MFLQNTLKVNFNVVTGASSKIKHVRRLTLRSPEWKVYLSWRAWLAEIEPTLPVPEVKLTLFPPLIPKMKSYLLMEYLVTRNGVQ